MTSEDYAQAAKDIVIALDNNMPKSPDRAAHKFNMIRIAERHAAGIDFDPDEAQEEILAASNYAGV